MIFDGLSHHWSRLMLSFFPLHDDVTYNLLGDGYDALNHLDGGNHVQLIITYSLELH